MVVPNNPNIPNTHKDTGLARSRAGIAREYVARLLDAFGTDEERRRELALGRWHPSSQPAPMQSLYEPECEYLSLRGFGGGCG